MAIWVGVAAALLAFAAMEALSWAVHKYVLHGPLWVIHQTHHRPGRGFFEANDLVSLFFALVGGFSLYWGLKQGINWLAGVGIGVSAYGTLYFILHDVAIHGRLRWRWLQRLPALRRLRRAHLLHHKSTERQPGRAFGLLYVKKSVITN